MGSIRSDDKFFFKDFMVDFYILFISRFFLCRLKSISSMCSKFFSGLTRKHTTVPFGPIVKKTLLLWLYCFLAAPGNRNLPIKFFKVFFKVDTP